MAPPTPSPSDATIIWGSGAAQAAGRGRVALATAGLRETRSIPGFPAEAAPEHDPARQSSRDKGTRLQEAAGPHTPKCCAK